MNKQKNKFPPEADRLVGGSSQTVLLARVTSYKGNDPVGRKILVNSVSGMIHVTSLEYTQLPHFYLFIFLLEHLPALSDRKSLYFKKPSLTTLLGQEH